MPDQKRKREYDVFKAFLVENADYTGSIELPCIKTSDCLPKKVIPFSKAMERRTTDFEQWVVFYEDDVRFEKLWHNPKQYLPKLKKFQGVISPDFSLYRNMPLVMQEWNTYRSRAIAAWLQSQGVEIIPNVRFSDPRSYAFCFDGIEKHKTVSAGTHGCIRGKENREYFKAGLKELICRLSPKTILVYGTAPEDIFEDCMMQGIKIVAFESELARSRKRVTA